MFKHSVKIAFVATLAISGALALATTTANAKSAYQITNIQTETTPKPYHVANPKKATYTWDKSHTKRLIDLNYLQYVSYFVTEKATMTHNGKTTPYVRIANEYGADYGYVAAKTLVKGYDPKDDENMAYQPSSKVLATIPISRVSENTFAKDIPSLTKNQYYRTTKAIKLTALFTTYLDMGDVDVNITLPKGTVVEGRRGYTGTTINTEYLSKNILKPGYKRGFWIANDALFTISPSVLRKVKHPAYLPKNGSHGDLYIGGATAIRNSFKSLASQTVQITSNGYVEVRKNKPTGAVAEYRAQPKQSIKIKRTRIKGHTRYLYLAKPLKGFKTTKVSYQGAKQYRLALTNPLKTYMEPSYDEDDNLTPVYYGQMRLGGKTFYTSYGEIPNDN